MSENPPHAKTDKKQKKQKVFKPKARLPRGFRDMAGDELHLQQNMLRVIAKVYEQYGFAQLDTPAFEYADALGKFLPDSDRPNAGVFALEDDDNQWLSLRYDLTAPLARYVSENYDHLPKPLRRYQSGFVFRNEKPGPGRYRQFMQMDADTVGAGNQAADAEICMMAADCMQALGLQSGDYVVRINNRKILDGILEITGLKPDEAEYETRRLIILRAMDKLDRLGLAGVRDLLGTGRKDESGDFTQGAGLDAAAIEPILAFLEARQASRELTLARLCDLVANSEIGQAGVAELRDMDRFFTALGYSAEQITIDPSVVRGLDYYTGPVFEIELTFEAEGEDGDLAKFGSVGGGGRYDDLVKRFKGIEVPATGISIGVSRLAAALRLKGTLASAQTAPLIVALIMDRETIAETAQLVQSLRNAGLRAEMYMGESGMKPQLRYADARGARLALIEGSDERERGVITIKDLQLGREKSAEIADNAEWRESQHSQFEVNKSELISKINEIIG